MTTCSADAAALQPLVLARPAIPFGVIVPTWELSHPSPPRYRTIFGSAPNWTGGVSHERVPSTNGMLTFAKAFVDVENRTACGGAIEAGAGAGEFCCSGTLNVAAAAGLGVGATSSIWGGDRMAAFGVAAGTMVGTGVNYAKKI
jgi:hypothetical protein